MTLINSSPVIDIVADIKELSKKANKSIGLVNIDELSEAVNKILPPQKHLWHKLWNEGEVCCLFAESNLGKSILAVQIANDIAQHQKVLYFDFELSDRQLQHRYKDNNGNTAKFSHNLHRATINTDALTGANIEEGIINTLEAVAETKVYKVFIIDNLSYLLLENEKSECAGRLMKQIMALKKKYDLSILIVGHTPKLPPFRIINLNDLAGSKQLVNFFDSVFAIGRSAKDENIRYIKQLKTRNSTFDYGTENVLTATIEKENAFLKFEFGECENEYELIKENTPSDTELRNNKIIELHKQGKSCRDIALILKTSKTTCNRVIIAYQKSNK